MDTWTDESEAAFDAYVEALVGVIGHADRAEPLKDYCLGLLMPVERKSVEPLAAVIAPSRVAAKHQSLLHFVGQAPWSDAALMGRVRDWVLPRIEQRGAIISEFPMGTFPAPQNFPIRNRIIAGIALGVVVVEGAQYSGSLITARLAMEFGREVFGVPGNATQPTSFGPNQLIKQGAKLVTSWEDVIEELPTPVRAELLPVESASTEERAALLDETFVPAERTLYGLLNVDEARHIDEIMEVSGLTSSEVLATLFDLELKGVVRQLPGKQFLKVLL